MGKVLLIEDDSLYVKMYEKKFNHEAIELATALDGTEGVEKSVSAKPDLILLDLMLPRMAGSEVLKKIRQNPVTADLPVIVMTNLNTSSDEVAECKKLGVKETLLKTDVTPDQLIQTVRKYLPN